MEDLLKDLAQAKPPAPEVDPERMERDLARIVSMGVLNGRISE